MLNSGAVSGMKLTSSTKPDPICEPCIAGKQHRNDTPKTATRAQRVGERVYMDIHELPVPSPEGYRYLADFIDDASRLWVLAPLKRKSEAFEVLKVYVAHAEHQTSCKVLCVHDDKGGEWMSNAEKFWCQEHGIRVEHTMRNEPHQKDRKSTRLNSSHSGESRMPSSA